MSIGQRFEPIVERFRTVKARFEAESPGSFYKGFVAEVGKEINGGVPLGATFGSPMTVTLSQGKHTVTFPTGGFTSFSFDGSGELDYLQLNPQLTYSTASESEKILALLASTFQDAGWRRIDGLSRWRAGWLKADLYVKRNACGAAGTNERCELVEAAIARSRRLSAKIVECGEVRGTPANESRRDPEAAIDSARTVDERAVLEFEPGCPSIEARLGVRFGISVLLEGEDGPSIESDLVTRVTHPPFTDGVTVTEWKSPMNVGIARYTGWLFENEKELEPGKWIFEVILGTETLARQEFEVRVPE